MRVVVVRGVNGGMDGWEDGWKRMGRFRGVL